MVIIGCRWLVRIFGPSAAAHGILKQKVVVAIDTHRPHVWPRVRRKLSGLERGMNDDGAVIFGLGSVSDSLAVFVLPW